MQGEGRELRSAGVSSYKYGTAVYISPNKPWRSNFIFNHMLTGYEQRQKEEQPLEKKPYRSSISHRMAPEHKVGRVLSVSPVVGIGTPPPL